MIRTEEGECIDIYDLIPDLDSYLEDVERNIGHPVTWKEVVDVLNDFGNVPIHWLPGKTKWVIETLAKQYCGVK
jgi:hypothetical protein